jgi:hypothetical protein
MPIDHAMPNIMSIIRDNNATVWFISLFILIEINKKLNAL